MGNKRKRRLVAFGCSNTYGHGLKDCWVNKDGVPEVGLQASKYAWPQLLSSYMGRTCTNLSNPGASIREVVHRIQTTTYQKGDIVVVMFPPVPRSCLISHNPNTEANNRYERYGDWIIEQIFINRRPKPTDLDKIWISNFADDSHIMLDWVTLSNYVYLFLKQKNIPAFYSTCGKSSIERKFVEEHNLTYIDYVPFFSPGVVEISKTMNDYALDNDHPGEQSHKIFADRIFQYISQNT
tara:strand:- start:1142 stop:1855 length:714 start_codon:yes stop_codon:yes gene_type:complete